MKEINRRIDLEELKELSVVGGNDEGDDMTPYASTTVPCSIIATVTVVTLVVSQTASCKEVC